MIHATTGTPGTTRTLDLDGKATTASLPHLLLFAGETMRDATRAPDTRAEARAVFDQLIALAVSHGFTRSQRLRELCADGFYQSPEASRLARMALQHVPDSAACAALVRAGFIDG